MILVLGTLNEKPGHQNLKKNKNVFPENSPAQGLQRHSFLDTERVKIDMGLGS